MKKLIIITLLAITPMFAFSQVYVKAPNGNVGVGMDTPTEKLEVAGIAKTEGNTVEATGASGTTLYERTDGAAVLIGAGFISAGFTVDEAFNFEVRTRARNFVKARLLSAGDLLLRGSGSTGFLGVNVTNPAERLHVNGNTQTNGIFITSDKRLKQNVNDFKYGLKEVMELRPLTYDYTGEAGMASVKNNIGLFAQDLQKIAPELVSEFTHTQEDDEGNVTYKKEYLKIYDTGIKYILINAIQEQQEIIETQEEKIATLEERLARIEAALNGGTINTDINRQDIQLDGGGAYLEQNQPNPFNTNTLINYNVPTDVTDAVINIFDAKGQLIHSERIAQVGQGQIQLKAGTIAAGTYSYSLVINGNIVDTKRMVIAK